MSESAHSDQSEIASLIRRAEAAIGRNEPDCLDIPPLDAQIAALPPEAGPLKRILESAPVRHVYAQRKEYEAAAYKTRRSYNRNVYLILGLLIVAIFASSLPALAPLVNQNNVLAQTVATILVYLCLVVPLFLAWRLNARNTYEKWSEARGTAEFLRRRVFETVFEAEEPAQSDEIPLLPLKLEYFRRYQLDVQQAYHGTRAEQNERWVRTARWFTVPVTIAVILWFAALVVEILSAWGEQAPLPDQIPGFVYHAMAYLQHIATDYTDIKFLLLGTGITILYGAIFLLTTLNSNLRNAARFAHARENLEYLRNSGLEEARKAAAKGEEAKVVNYANRVHSAMSAELNDWVRLMDLDQGREAQAVPGAPVPAPG